MKQWQVLLVQCIALPILRAEIKKLEKDKKEQEWSRRNPRLTILKALKACDTTARRL